MPSLLEKEILLLTILKVVLIKTSSISLFKETYFIMKKNYILLALITLCFGLGCQFSPGNGGQSISVSRTDLNYQFKAEFPKEKSGRVFAYIERELSSQIAINGEEEKNIKLQDGALFHLKAAEGLLKIEFNRQDNSEAAWQRLEQLCMGIKKELER